ncbi:MAG: FAD-dependent oxidoreductase, partial [Firmicutes bacterium]|nr:FAD-dependent oxidoreductase [Bacillota bacterium]
MSCCESKDEREVDLERAEGSKERENIRECSAAPVEKKIAKSTIGSVMVVGGGIGGMQSALDLAETGFKVYLVEKEPAIGGMMARLDKTFPTNDCAMCTMSPKLVDTGRHLNVEIITGAEVRRVDGNPGNFRVRLHKKARYVDINKCTGCGDCSRACPVEVPNKFDDGLGDRKAVYKLYPQATPGAYGIEKKGTPPCRAACPAGVNAQGYVQLIKTGRFLEAWELIYRDNPFPAVCGRICNHPCQSRCHRAKADAPVGIRELKRVAADFAYRDKDGLPIAPPPEQNGEK